MAEMARFELVVEREHRLVQLRFQRGRQMGDDGIAWETLHIAVGVEFGRDSGRIFWTRERGSTHGVGEDIQLSVFARERGLDVL